MDLVVCSAHRGLGGVIMHVGQYCVPIETLLPTTSSRVQLDKAYILHCIDVSDLIVKERATILGTM